MESAIFHDLDGGPFCFQMEAGAGVNGGRQRHSRNVNIVDIAVDESDEVRRFHRVKCLTDTNDDVDAGKLGDELALLAYRYTRNVLDCRFLALLLGFNEDSVILCILLPGRHADRAGVRGRAEFDMTAHAADKNGH